MSELPDDDPLVERAVFFLTRRLATFYDKAFNQSTLDELVDLMRHTRDTFKRVTGYDFPPLTVLLLPTSQVAHIYRADLGDREISIKVLNLLRELSHAKMPVVTEELATAIKFAWPMYRPPIEDWRKDGQVTLN